MCFKLKAYSLTVANAILCINKAGVLLGLLFSYFLFVDLKGKELHKIQAFLLHGLQKDKSQYFGSQYSKSYGSTMM